MARPASPCPFYGMPCQYVPMAHRTDELEQENTKLREALERIQNTASPDIVWSWYRDVARAVLGGDND